MATTLKDLENGELVSITKGNKIATQTKVAAKAGQEHRREHLWISDVGYSPFVPRSADNRRRSPILGLWRCCKTEMENNHTERQ